MDLADGLGVLPGTGRVGTSLVVVLGRGSGVVVALSWLSLLHSPWLAIAVGSHYSGHMVVVARPGLTPFVVVPI